MRTLFRALLLAVLVVPVAYAGAERSSASSGIVATFLVVDETFRAHIENPDTIDQVLALMEGESSATIPVATLRAGEEYNTGWSWHTDPWEIQMAEVAIEVCDGLPSFVEANLDYWLNTVGQYCPWSAVLVNVVFLGDPATPTPTATPGEVGGAAGLPPASAASATPGSGFDAKDGAVLAIGAALVLALAGAVVYLRPGNSG